MNKKMTINKAHRIAYENLNKPNLDADEEFLMIEAFKYLIDITKDPNYMVDLGGYYYGTKDFELALKYYELADEYHQPWAPEGLGYIWYYGRTGEINYEKAFKYFSKAANNGYLNSKLKLADMYKNGYYVDKNEDKYVDIINQCYTSLDKYDYHLPNVYTRLAKIKTKNGKKEEAISLYLDAINYLTKRFYNNCFFGDITMMKWAVNELYELIDFDYSNFKLFDLFYVFKKPNKVLFNYLEDEYLIEAILEDDTIVIKFNDNWYRSLDDFLLKAKINDELIVTISNKLYNFRVI